MRFKMLLVLSLIAFASFSTGCGGGGGGGDATGGTGGTTTTTYKVSGNVEVPAITNDSWSASIRPAFGLSTLKVTAYGKAGTSIGEGPISDANTGAFSISITPDEQVTLKVTNSKGFEFRKLIGKVAADTSAGAIDATTTVQLLLADSTSGASGVSTTLLNSFLTYLSASQSLANLTTNETIAGYFERLQGTTIEKFKTAQATIIANNQTVADLIKAKNVDGAAAYFSNDFTSSVTGEKSIVNLSEFKRVMNYRFDQKYESIQYNLAATDIKFLDSGKTIDDDLLSAEVTVKGTAVGTLKSGGTNNSGTVTGKITWRKESGKWVVYMDFPFLTEQSSWQLGTI